MQKVWDRTVGYLPDPGNLTDRDKYWIGYFRADGTVIDSGIRRGFSQFSQSVRQPIEEFAKYLGLSDNRISSKTYKPTSLPRQALGDENRLYECHTVRSTPLGLIYLKLGVKASLTEAELYKCKHFWRGLVDGDGSIHVKESIKLVRLNLLLNDEDAEAFSCYCRGLQVTPPAIERFNKINRIQLSQNRAQFLVKTLYQGEYSANEAKRLKAERAIAVGYSSRDRLFDVQEIFT